MTVMSLYIGRVASEWIARALIVTFWLTIGKPEGLKPICLSRSPPSVVAVSPVPVAAANVAARLRTSSATSAAFTVLAILSPPGIRFVPGTTESHPRIIAAIIL